MSNRTLGVAGTSGTAVRLEELRDNVTSTAGVPAEFIYDAPQLAASATAEGTAASIPYGIERLIEAPPQRNPRLVLTVVGAMFVSFALIASAIVATLLYL